MTCQLRNLALKSRDNVIGLESTKNTKIIQSHDFNINLILNRVRSLSPTVGSATIHCGHCHYTVGDSIMRVG
ncbi:hypothetical protein BpHYR1_022698 [Brachionus plicatilis]|uniref:Uncharacterized protein n=1 Tax=Brachionus plicatilis TaxID=10195 RepID=A0A3M7RCV2_BRAPC|nr:hypothetical protein BpHYR1_022698 [Brachionus plicatilis]